LTKNLPQLSNQEIKLRAEEERLRAEEERINETAAPLMEHLIELRNRLFWSVLAIVIAVAFCFAFSRQIFEFLLIPYKEAAIAIKGAEALGNLQLIFTAPMESFFAMLDVSIFGGLCLSFPIIAWQMYRFIAPGLYSHEKGAFLPFLLMAPVLFTAGATMAYYIAMPMVMQFSLRQEIFGGVSGIDVAYQGKVSEYIQMITTLVLGFGVCFQIPVVQLLLGRAELVSADFWLKSGRYAILAIVTVSAFITPPDVISQLLMSFPLVILYYSGAWLVKLGEKKRAKPETI
jgi:sec-independent protein translocase protein TatC